MNLLRHELFPRRQSAMTPSRVLVAIALVSALAVAEAHPSLWNSRFCDENEHPTTRQHGHGATSVDANIGFTLAWAAPDGSDAAQSNEADPYRAIPTGWEIATAEFKPGARHTLTVVNPDVGEMMVTCSHGSFEEFGRRLDGNVRYGNGVQCDGKRYSTSFRKPNTRFVWNAPDATDLGSTTNVVFKVTTASGWNGAFRNNRATFAANQALPPPPPGAASETPPPGARDEANAAHGTAETTVSAAVAAHGWLMALAWGVLVPFGVWSARYGKAPPGGDALDERDADRDAAWRRARAWVGAEGRWFKMHRALTASGLALALLGVAIMVAEAEEHVGEHLVSAHSALGTATLVLGFAQPLNAYFRPDAPSGAARAAGVGTLSPKSTARFAWEAAHRVLGASAFVCSVFAITSGTDRARVYGEPDWRARRARDAYLGWVAVVAAATAALEALRRRERRDAPRAPPYDDVKEVELADA